MKHHTTERRIVLPLLLLGIALLWLVSPLRRLWLDASLPWFAPFVVWGAIVLLAGLLLPGRTRGP
jgi:hypothetical protein